MTIGTLVDTGPLFALVDPEGQREKFTQCRRARQSLEMPLVTTWACLTEALYLTGRTGGRKMQKRIGLLLSAGEVVLSELSPQKTKRVLELMDKYEDRPMDLADASLIVLAETHGYTRIFSLDSDFYIYRLADSRALEVVPGPPGSP